MIRSEIVSVEEFWEMMCKPGFIRTGRLCGRIGETVYLTFEAPEEIHGFIEQHMPDVGRLLG